ncbi:MULTISPECIES: OTU domain-containing protein [unclassified Wolbachia]|uniref:hypothetical protein n=1 Tax=unclassified Wolbachia TaxID=2640676 RepID=UPI00222F2F2D|nr:hypothetical protein [Wolbachia endosymbiont (group A) of Andrena dorsata]
MHVQQDQSYNITGASKRLTRDPISIFRQIKEAKDEKQKIESEELLSELRNALPKEYKIGAAVGGEDCFFDSVAQGLNELKDKGLITGSKGFSIKSLRESCKQYARQVNQSEKGLWLDNALKEKGEELYEYIPRIEFTVEDIENANSGSEIKILKLENAIWGRPEIEGKMICEKYGIKIRVIKLRDEEIDGLHVTKDKVGKGNTIYIVNYRNHFIPLLSNIKKDIKKSIEVSREEAYGNVVGSNSKNISQPYISKPLQDIESFSHKQSGRSRSPGEENRETDVSSGKRKRSVTNKNNKASKRARMDVNVTSNENSEFPSDLQDESRQDELHNACQTKRYIPHHLIKLMYQLDLSVLCSLRKSTYEHKYPLLSLAFGDSEIDKFNDIALHYEEKSIHIRIENVDKYYTDNDINYAKLFNKGEQSFSINNYFDSFVKHLTSRVDSSLDNIEYLVIYTNSGLDLTEEKELKKGRSRNFYPFKFDIISIEKYGILKDFLFTNDNTQGRGFYQFSQNKITRGELLKRLEFSSAAQKVMKKGEFSQEKVKEKFLDRLVFAVNQPNREELNSIIKSEIEKNSKVQYDYIALQEEILRDPTASGRYKKLGPGIIYEFNLLMLFLHDMFLHKNISSINSESHGISNDITINYKDRITYIKAHNADSNIGYSQLFPSRRQEKNNTSSINKHFALFIEELEKDKDIKYFIIYTNADLDLTEEKKLKKGQSEGFYPLKFDSIDLQKKKYKILRNYSCINKNGLYRFAQEAATRRRLLSLLELLPSLQKEKGGLSNENKQEIKEKLLDKLIFATNQPNREELNNIIKDEIDKSDVPYNYEELHEIALRWSESHEFGHITKGIMEKLLGDIKNNRSSYQKIQKNIDEEIKFAGSMVGRKGTPTFDQFLDFLIKGEGEKYLKVLKKEGISLTNVSSILGGAKGKAPTAFKGLYDLWFDEEGNKTQYLKTLEKEGINLANISSILNRAKGEAPTAFKDLYDLWFNEEGNKTQYLKTLEREGINLASMSSILSGARAKASTAFKDLYDLWFNEEGNKTQYLKTLEREGINLASMSSILSGAGAKASTAFKDLYDLWFNEEGNKTQYLKTLEREGINLASMSSILSGAGAKASTAFKDLYDLWFNEDGNKTQYLKTLEEEGIDLANISSILHGTGANATTAFKGLYDLWFDEGGNKTQYLKTLEEEGIDLANISSILHGTGANATTAFKGLYDLWFDEGGNKTQYLKTLEEEGIDLTNMSNILHGVGTNAATAFKTLYNLWFGVKGNKAQHLKILEEKGIDLTNMSSILGGSGTNIATAFKELYDLWFDEEGNKTQYLKTLDKEGVSLANMSSILGGAGANAATAFKNLYDLWFDEKENKTQYLKILKKEKINLANISSILHGAGANAATAFKNLYDLWFDEKENKTQYLKTLEEKGINLTNMSSILNGAGANAAAAFKSLYDLWFDEEGNKTQYLKILEKDGMSLANISSILHGAGANASKAFKELFDAFFDEQGNRKQHLKHFFIEEKGREKSFKLSNLSSILSKTGTRAVYTFEKLHNVCFNDEGKRTKLLDDFYKAGFRPSNLSSALCGAGARASSILKRLHSVCFNEKGEVTKLLDDFYKVGFRPGNLCSMLSGATNNLEKNLEEFHDFCFIGDTKRYLNHFLIREESFTLSNLSKILHGAGANICSALKNFHDVCFDEKGSETQLLGDFRKVGFTPSDLSNILSMAGNNATFILRNFHKVCFNKENYLNHFLAEKKLFTPKDLSRILHGVGIDVCSIFKRLHDLCFNKEGNKTKYLNNLIKNDRYKISDILHEQVKKAPPIFLGGQNVSEEGKATNAGPKPSNSSKGTEQEQSSDSLQQSDPKAKRKTQKGNTNRSKNRQDDEILDTAVGSSCGSRDLSPKQIQLVCRNKKQREVSSQLSKFASSIQPVKQGLYLPSFEERGVKIGGKCVAITRSLSQALFLRSNKSFLSNLETSSEIYERIAQGKQVSKREEREVFAFNKLLDGLEQHLDSSSSLPLDLIHTRCYKILNDLSNYMAGIKGNFAIHLVTSNHVVAIYRAGNSYAYFDSNAAFVSGLKNVDQLIEVVEIGVKSAGYKMGEKGFLVEHFDIAKANRQLFNEDKQILAKEIKTERQLLAEQDKKLGLIKINGQELSRVQLYDFGTKINIEGSVPLLINADMNLSSKKFQDLIDKKEVSMTAREYIDSLKNGKNMEEVVQATKVIPFIGSKSEIGEAEQTRELKFSLKRSIKHLATVFRNSSTTDSATIASTVSLTNTSRSESQSPGTTDETNDRPESYLSGVTVNNQLKRSR